MHSQVGRFPVGQTRDQRTRVFGWMVFGLMMAGPLQAALAQTLPSSAPPPIPAPAPAATPIAAPPTNSAPVSLPVAPAQTPAQTQKKDGVRSHITDCISRSPNPWKDSKGNVKKSGPDETREDYPPGPVLIGSTYFLPAGTNADFVLKDEFNSEAVYFARVEGLLGQDGKGAYFEPVSKDSLSVRQIPPEHPLVIRGLASKSDTLVTVEIPDKIAGLWQPAKVYVYACTVANGSPAAVSSVTLPVSSWRWSSFFVWLAVAVMYVGAAISSRSIDQTNPGVSWKRYLDPAFMTAGADGKGSLAKLQILFFSTIVVGLLGYIVARTGLLSDLSPTILMLLGIAAIGSTAAKGTDVRRSRIDFKNLAWFVKKGWLTPIGLAAENDAKWSDIITSDGEFDVYRYQNCIFSLVVGGALLAAGINELSSFAVPETVLGVLGLSQVVYVAGKLVSPASFDDLNDAAKKAAELEDGVLKARLANPPGGAVGSHEYSEYKKGSGKRGICALVSDGQERCRSQTRMTARTVAVEPANLPERAAAISSSPGNLCRARPAVILSPGQTTARRWDRLFRAGRRWAGAQPGVVCG